MTCTSRLPAGNRAVWDALVESECAGIGLANLKCFLENKMVNDIFYEGTFKGRAVVVKCSSKAPDSIVNEFNLSKRVHAADPSATPEPLAYHVSQDGLRAFIVTAKAAGPSFAQLLSQGVTEARADSFAADILRIRAALEKAGVIHRDLFAENLLLDSDGHLKAIDFQFAIDRNDYRESRWMQKNWKYRYVIFGVNHNLGLGVWDDAAALKHLLALLPSTESTEEAIRSISSKIGSLVCSARPGPLARLRLSLYAISLRIQLLFKKKDGNNSAHIRNRLARLSAANKTKR